MELKIGVNLKIITGDNRFVAAHVASSVGLKVTKILSGKDLDALSDEALLRMAEMANIAEADLSPKTAIVITLERMGT